MLELMEQELRQAEFDLPQGGVAPQSFSADEDGGL